MFNELKNSFKFKNIMMQTTQSYYKFLFENNIFWDFGLDGEYKMTG